MKAVIIVLGILICSVATAEPRAWMKKSNPDRLTYHLAIDSFCPVTTPEVREMVDGVLIRSRLRPGKYFSSPDLVGFGIYASCLARRDGSVIFDLDLRWLRHVAGEAMVDLTATYGAVGVGDKELFKTTLRDNLEQLVKDYLQANFDLSPE